MEIYQPEEDSYLMQKVLKKYIKDLDMNILEIGGGSGIQLKTLKKIGIKKIEGIDINPSAVKHCKELGFKCKKSNLFSNVKGKFDVIIFNPPYLPKDENEPKSSRIATTGGKHGSETINRFLIQAKNHLNKNGKILLLVSNLTKKINWKGYKKRILAKKKIFFEELSVVELASK
tara:strand:+ start:803 stop:1324 length:522 start_codon:yes stop_codon:yes gene_type:complete